MDDLDVVGSAPVGAAARRGGRHAALRDRRARRDESSRLDIAGVRGCADAVVIAALVRAGGPPVVAVAEDGDAARALAKDVTFLLGPVTRSQGNATATGAPAQDDDDLTT